MSVTVLLSASLVLILMHTSASAPNDRECCSNVSDPEELMVCEALMQRNNIYDSLSDELLTAPQHTIYRVAVCLEKREHRHKPRLHFHDAMCCDITKLASEKMARCQRACHGSFLTPRLPWTEKVAVLAGCMGETSAAFSRLFASCVQLGHEAKHGLAELFGPALFEHHESDITGYA